MKTLENISKYQHERKHQASSAAHRGGENISGASIIAVNAKYRREEISAGGIRHCCYTVH